MTVFWQFQFRLSYQMLIEIVLCYICRLAFGAAVAVSTAIVSLDSTGLVSSAILVPVAISGAFAFLFAASSAAFFAAARLSIGTGVAETSPESADWAMTLPLALAATAFAPAPFGFDAAP